MWGTHAFSCVSAGIPCGGGYCLIQNPLAWCVTIRMFAALLMVTNGLFFPSIGLKDGCIHIHDRHTQ